MSDGEDTKTDRLVSWALTAFAGLALSMGAFFFRDLSGEVRGLRDAVSGLQTEIALTRSTAQLRMRELERRIEKLEGK